VWYHFGITVPAGTTEASPIEQDIKLTHGVVKYLAVGFPAGCNQLVNVRIYHLEHQIFPSNPDEPAAWSGGREGGEEHYKLEGTMNTLTVRAYAPDSAHAHTITVFVLLLPVEAAEPWQEPKNTMDKIKSLFGLG
jgi:hypothetical protein